jgi:hypothetical protein
MPARFRLLDLFKWTTVVAVVLVPALAIARKQNHLSTHVAVAYIIAFWTPALVVAYFGFRWLAKGQNDRWAIYGMAVGIAFGIAVGCTSELGYWLSEVLEPGEPPHFNATKFGVIFGAIFGAFVGALIGGIAGRLSPRSVAA